ncbi:MAG: ATP-binding protein [Bacteroidaceae bacterium]|nr:ATP-binding protein [Bacteroidaceae bacterium]
MSFADSDMQIKDIVLDNEVQEVSRLGVFVNEICTDLYLDIADATAVNVAVEEAVANAISYAYPDGVKGKVVLKVLKCGERLIFEVRDQGRPFDPTAKDVPDISESAEKRKIGGLGIFLMRHYMDEIRYERRDNENILTLIKTIKSQ